MTPVTWKTHPSIRRHPANPVLSAKDVPYPAGLVFNAGVTKFKGRYVMVFRNDPGDPVKKELNGTPRMGIAVSDDGVRWKVENRLLFPDPAHPLFQAYDPRLTVVDGRLFLCFATGAFKGPRFYGTCGGVAVTDNLVDWEVLDVSAPDNRNMVIFPERFGGRLARLERPFAGYLRPGDRFDTWLSFSPDGRHWGGARLVLGADEVPWVNNKVGPAAPPIRTTKGWLSFFHGVDVAEGRAWGWDGKWNKRYSAGLMLLDPHEPWKVIGLSDGPVLVPEPQVPYEAAGYRDYVIFPGGMVLEPDGEVKVYYGAADTVEALATARLDDLLALIHPIP